MRAIEAWEARAHSPCPVPHIGVATLRDRSFETVCACMQRGLLVLRRFANGPLGVLPDAGSGLRVWRQLVAVHPGERGRSLCACGGRLSRRPRAFERRPCVAREQFLDAAVHRGFLAGGGCHTRRGARSRAPRRRPLSPPQGVGMVPGALSAPMGLTFAPRGSRRGYH